MAYPNNNSPFLPPIQSPNQNSNNQLLPPIQPTYPNIVSPEQIPLFQPPGVVDPELINIEEETPGKIDESLIEITPEPEQEQETETVDSLNQRISALNTQLETATEAQAERITGRISELKQKRSDLTPTDETPISTPSQTLTAGEQFDAINTQYKNNQSQIANLRTQTQNYQTELNNVNNEIATSNDPVERDRLGTRKKELQDAINSNTQTLTDLSNTQSQLQTDIDFYAKQASNDRLLASRESGIAKQKDLESKARIERADLEKNKQSAQLEVDRDRREYQQILKSGPDISKGVGIAAVIGEILMAHAYRREPDMAKVQNQLMAFAKSRFDSKLAAKLDEVKQGEDKIGSLAEQQRVTEVETQKQIAAVWAELGEQLKNEELKATSDMQRVNLARARQEAQAQQALAQEKAIDRQLERNIKITKERRENLKTAAELGKTEAEIGKIRSETQKKLSVGGTRRISVIPPNLDPQLAPIYAQDKKAAKEIHQLGLRDPNTQRYIQNPDGNFPIANSDSEAKELRANIANTGNVVDLLDQAISLRLEHGYEPTSKYWSSDAGTSMQSISKQLLIELNKMKKLGALDAGSLEILEQITGGDLTGIKDPLAALRTLRQNSLNNLNKDMGTKSNFKGKYNIPSPTQKASKDSKVLLRQSIDTYNPTTGLIGNYDSRKARIDDSFQKYIIANEGDRKRAVQNLKSDFKKTDHDKVLEKIKTDIKKAEKDGNTELANNLRATWAAEKLQYSQLESYIKSLAPKDSNQAPLPATKAKKTRIAGQREFLF